MGARTRAALPAFAAGAAILLASLANFITHNDYPFFRPEVGLVALAMLAVAAVMVLAYLPQAQWWRSLLEGALAAFFVDLNSDVSWLSLAAGILVAAYTFWRRASLLGPMTVLGAVVFLTTLMGIGVHPNWITVAAGDEQAAPRGDKPAIVHLVLDEHLGLEGMAVEGEEGRALRDSFRDFYLGHGFALYGRAYSRYTHTANSVPFILNYGTRPGETVEPDGAQAGQTDHLKLLVDKGYRLTVMQSDYADFCTGARYYECVTYDSSSLAPTLKAPLSTGQRAQLIAYKFATLSEAMLGAVRQWNRTAPSVPGMKFIDLNNGLSSSVGTYEALPQLFDRLGKARPGDAIFAHLLLPHHPYVLDRNCRFLPWPWTGMKTPLPLAGRRKAYYEQARCMERIIQAALAALAKSPAGANSIVILHGDHGSRLARYELDYDNRLKISDADVVAAVSTLFAVRGPGIAPGYYVQPQPIVLLLGDLARSDFRKAAADRRRTPPIRLVDRRLEQKGTIPLPEKWASGK